MTVQPGDILLWKIDAQASWIERLVGWGERRAGQPKTEGADFYHVGICGPDALHFYDSAPGGVKNSLITEPWPDHLEAYRFKFPLTETQLAKFWSYANSQKGVGYNWIGALTLGWVQVAGKPFCSEFVWRICANAGIVLCDYQTFLSPDDLAHSDIIVKIGDVPPPVVPHSES
jgi:hypothetical protein